MTRTATRFRYRGARSDGTIEFGALDAESHESVRVALAARSILPIEIVEETTSGEGGSRLRAADLAVGLRVLATLFESGLPIAKALATFVELAPAGWRHGLEAVRAGVTQGRSLAAALEASPLRIPGVLIGIVRAGEAAGTLASAVRAAAELAERQAAARAALHAALAYPLVLAVAAAGSVGVLVGAVVPRFAKILADVGGTLPPSAAAVVAVAGAARSAFLPALVCGAVVVAAWRGWVRTPDGCERWHRWLLSVPGVGTVRRSAATGRFCSALAALLGTGVPLAAALGHASTAMGDAALRAEALAARRAVIEGQSLSRALESHRVTTPATVRLIRAGEESGNVAAMLRHAAGIELERAERLVKASLRFVEPAMILILGGAIAVVAAALLQALYGMRAAA